MSLLSKRYAGYSKMFMEHIKFGVYTLWHEVNSIMLGNWGFFEFGITV